MADAMPAVHHPPPSAHHDRVDWGIRARCRVFSFASQLCLQRLVLWRNVLRSAYLNECGEPLRGEANDDPAVALRVADVGAAITTVSIRASRARAAGMSIARVVP